MSFLDQDRAAHLNGVARWRAVYHHTTTDDTSKAETIAWFQTTAASAWAEAFTHLPPAGYDRPCTVTIERGTFNPLPEGGFGWQPLGPTQTAQVNDHGLALHTNDEQPDPTPAKPAAVAAGQSTLF